MTVAAWASRRDFSDLPPAEARLIRVAPDTEVLAHCYWQRGPRPVLVALHGLEGSSSVHYMKGLARQAWTRGWHAVLLNQRNCGGTEHLTPHLYHSALTADPLEVIRTIVQADPVTDVFVVGYSLGGNLALRLAGELGSTSSLPIRGVAAVCPTVDLERCVRAIERPRNIAYHLNFVRNLRARLRRKAAAWPGLYDLAPLSRVWSIRAFDDVYTAPLNGFGNAKNYYERASALRVISAVRIPTLILSAADDPFVPPEQFTCEDVRSNPHVTAIIPPRGGHCAFVSQVAGPERFWAEACAVAFLDRIATTPRGRSPL